MCYLLNVLLPKIEKQKLKLFPSHFIVLSDNYVFAESYKTNKQTNKQKTNKQTKKQKKKKNLHHVTLSRCIPKCDIGICTHSQMIYEVNSVIQICTTRAQGQKKDRILSTKGFHSLKF